MRQQNSLTKHLDSILNGLGGWQNFLYNEQVHVVPMNDLNGHILGYQCKCNPRPSHDEECLEHAPVIHNSFDKREYFEGKNEHIKFDPKRSVN